MNPLNLKIFREKIRKKLQNRIFSGFSGFQGNIQWYYVTYGFQPKNNHFWTIFQNLDQCVLLKTTNLEPLFPKPFRWSHLDSAVLQTILQPRRYCQRHWRPHWADPH